MLYLLEKCDDEKKFYKFCEALIVSKQGNIVDKYWSHIPAIAASAEHVLKPTTAEVSTEYAPLSVATSPFSEEPSSDNQIGN
jgi:hypothetical protein